MACPGQRQYTMADIGYDDPILLAQLNCQDPLQQVAPVLPPAAYPPPVGSTVGVYPPGTLPPPTSTAPAGSGPGYATAFTGVPPTPLPVASAMIANPLFSPGDPISFPTAPASGGTPTLGSACDYITDPTLRAICKAGVTVGQVTGLIPGGTSSSASNTGTGGCPAGYHAEAGKGCVINGPGQYLPGDVGRPDVIWSPVMGRFGQGASPMMVQATRLACPAGMVLGKDNVCYDRIARGNRKWNPGHKPLLTGGEMNALRTTRRVEKKWRKVAPAFHKKVVNQGARLKKAPK